MAAYFNKIQQMWYGIPANRYAFFVDNHLICVLSYFPEQDGDRHGFLKDNRLFWARSEDVSCERIHIKLVENVNGLAPIFQMEDFSKELSVTDLVDR